MPNSSRYSQYARRALGHAHALVKRYHHPYVDTGHLLVGVMLTEGSIGCQVLHDMNLRPAQAEIHLQTLYPVLGLPHSEPEVDEALESALKLAAEEAAWLSHHYVGTEHLLLGMTQTNSGSATALLRRMGSSAEHLRHEIRRALRDGASEFDLQTARQVAQLSELSRRVLNAAEQRAASLNHPAVGLGHLLLELAQETRSPTAQVLRGCGLDERRLRHDLEQMPPVLLLDINPMMARVVELAGRVGSHYIGTEHLLMVIAQDPAGEAVLRTYGVDPTLLQHRLEMK